MVAEIRSDVLLTNLNTFRIPAKATSYVKISSEQDLRSLFEGGQIPTTPMLVLGGGSNILFTQNYAGMVLKVGITGMSTQTEGSDIFIRSGAGVVWNDLVKYAVRAGYGGMENLSLIPGTVGAAPVQNIGAYGVELKDIFHSCRAFELETGTIRIFSNNDCQFGYRDSIFKGALKGKYIITEVTFKLQSGKNLNTSYGAIGEELKKRGIIEPTVQDISDVVSHIRVSKLPDPSTIGNAGSFFKNPVVNLEVFNNVKEKFPEVVNYPAGADKVKLAAGWLIEQCGFKGKISGHTGTWKNQALVLVNHGGATGAEVYAFSEQIIETVKSKFGIILEREVNIF